LTEFTKTTVLRNKIISDEQILKEEFDEILKENDFVEEENLTMIGSKKIEVFL
jgi:hypothetical protein